MITIENSNIDETKVIQDTSLNFESQVQKVCVPAYLARRYSPFLFEPIIILVNSAMMRNLSTDSRDVSKIQKYRVLGIKSHFRSHKSTKIGNTYADIHDKPFKYGELWQE